MSLSHWPNERQGLTCPSWKPCRLASQERSWPLAKLPRNQQSVLVNRRFIPWSLGHGASPTMNDNEASAVPSLSHHKLKLQGLSPTPHFTRAGADGVSHPHLQLHTPSWQDRLQPQFGHRGSHCYASSVLKMKMKY